MNVTEQLQLLCQERKEQITQAEQAEQEQLEAQAEELALWVINWMVEHQTRKATISNTYHGFIEIGDWVHGHTPKTTSRKFNYTVVKAMVAYFNKQHGFSAHFHEGHFPASYDEATVKMN